MILVLLVTGFALASNAQEEKKKTVIELPQWVKNIKLSGYGMLQYQVQNPDDKTENSFNLRLMRLILDGKIGDFAWRVQMQGSSNAGPGNPTVMLVDLFALPLKTPPILSHRDGIPMLPSSTRSQVSVTVLVRKPQVVVISVYRYREIF